VQEDDVVEHTLDTGNPNNREGDEEQTPPLGRGTTAGGVDDNGYDSSSSSESSSSRSSVDRHRSICKPKTIKKIKKRTDRGKTPEQQQWETTTGIVTPETSSKMSKRMKSIKIDAPENLNSGDKKWWDSQYLDTWVNAIQTWLSMKGIRLESKEALDFIGFKLQCSALTTYNHHLLKEKDKASFCRFILVLREFLIPSTSKDFLWKEWEAASPQKDGRHMGIKTYANWLEELQIKLVDKDGNQCISEEVKCIKFLNHLPDYMETTLVPQILDSWTFNDLVKKAESYEAVWKHGRISTAPKPARQPTTPSVPNPGRNHHRDRKTENKKTSSNPERTPATKTTTTKDPDWEVVNKTLTSQDKMKLIRERKCLWSRAPGHTFKECKKRIYKVPVRTAAKVLSLQHASKPVIAKNNFKGKTKAKPQSTEDLHYSRVRVKVNGHSALALVDLQTPGGDLISAQFVHLYGLPTYGIDKKSLNTAIKGSKGVIEKACDVRMDYGGYTKTRKLYVTHLAGWDMILGKPALTDLNALIPVGPKPVTIQPEGMARFALKEWRKAGLAMGQVTSAALFIEDEAPDYLLPLFEFMVSSMSLGESREFNPFVEFDQLFPATIPNELPPLRTINHRICPKPGSTWVPKWRPSPSKFYAELTRQLTEEVASGRIYRSEHDINAVVLFVQAKRDDPTKPRRIPDARDRNEAVEANHTPLPNIGELMELVAARIYWSMIDLAEGYHHIRIEEDLEQHSTFLTHLIYYRSGIMQQGDRNAPATMVQAMYEIFKDMVFKDLVIYIDNIIIFSHTYD